MKCNEICDKLSLYIDNELSNEEMLQMGEHLQSCENCQKELEEYKELISVLQSLPDEEPPEGYCKRLHNKLLDISPQIETSSQTETKERSKIKKINRFKWMKYGSIAAAFVLVFIVANMNNISNFRMGTAKNESSYDMASTESPAEYGVAGGMPTTPQSAPPMMEESYTEAEYDNRDAIEPRGGSQPNTPIMMSYVEEREMKIIKNGTISAQTEDYDTFLNDLSVKLSSLGGFLESNNTEVYQVYNDEKLMYGNVKIRVPQESFYELVDYLENNSDVRRKNINETDVTKEYYEKDNKVKNLEVQEGHLRELFEKATTVEEMLLIENELRRVRTEIDALNISLSDINDRAAMSTIDLQIEEVLTASLTLKTKDSVWERSKDGFINTLNGIIRSIENFLVGIVSSSPILIPFIIIAIVGFFKIKKYWRKHM